MRDFVDQHPSYKHDSNLNDEIVFDLLQKIAMVSSKRDNVRVSSLS
jgi:hypothetical protein